MYNTPEGIRVLEGAERRLFVESLGMIVDDLTTGDLDFGIAAFDDLQRNQTVSALHTVARALLCRDEPPPRLTAAIEATVAIIYDHARDMLLQELEPESMESIECLGKRTPSWRQLVLAACEELDLADELPLADNDDRAEWDIVVMGLEDCVLWDADWQMQEHLDADPETSRRVKAELGIDDDYFVIVPPEPTDEEIQHLFAELQQLTADAR